MGCRFPRPKYLAKIVGVGEWWWNKSLKLRCRHGFVPIYVPITVPKQLV